MQCFWKRDLISRFKIYSDSSDSPFQARNPNATPSHPRLLTTPRPERRQSPSRGSLVKSDFTITKFPTSVVVGSQRLCKIYTPLLHHHHDHPQTHQYCQPSWMFVYLWWFALVLVTGALCCGEFFNTAAGLDVASFSSVSLAFFSGSVAGSSAGWFRDGFEWTKIVQFEVFFWRV